MNKLKRVWIVVAAVALGNVCAQSNKPLPKPDLPYFKLPQPGSAWTVNIEYDDELVKKMRAEPTTSTEAAPSPTPAPVQEAATSRPVRIESLLGTNRIQKVTTTFTEGRKDDGYILGNVMLQKYEHSNEVAILAAEPTFPGLGWMENGAQYVGVETIDKNPYYKFKIKESYLRQIPWPLDTQYFAWIDPNTGFPFIVQNNEVTYKFSPISRDANPVNLPPEFEAAAKKALEERKMTDAFRRLNAR